MNIAELHPAFVHFPIALTITGLICFLLGYAKWPEFQRLGLILLGFAFLFSFLSVFTGEKAAEIAKKIPGIEEPLGKHAELGEWTRWVLGFAFIVGLVSQVGLLKSRVLAALFFLSYLFAAGFVGYVGYLGGELVLEHGAGFRGILSLSPVSEGEQL